MSVTTGNAVDQAWAYLTKVRVFSRGYYDYKDGAGALVSQDYEATYMGGDPKVALLLIALARYVDTEGRWATSQDLATFTGLGRSMVNTGLRALRERHGDIVRHNKVGHVFKHTIAF